MSTIIVCTDFSNTSRNALAYIGNLVKDKANASGIELLLLHIFTIPITYSGEGLSIITINDEWQDAEIQMQQELQWAREQFSDLPIYSKIITGRLLEELQQQIELLQPTLLVMGASGHFGEMWSWDRDILDLLIDATIPVLTVPPHVSFTPVHNIGYACNLRHVNQRTPFETLKRWTRFTGATLHVLFVTPFQMPSARVAQQEEMVQNELKEVAPVYNSVSETEVLERIGHFAHEHQLDLLFVTPKRQGVWQALFRKSHTEALMRLNAIPIMALHGR